MAATTNAFDASNHAEDVEVSITRPDGSEANDGFPASVDQISLLETTTAANQLASSPQIVQDRENRDDYDFATLKTRDCAGPSAENEAGAIAAASDADQVGDVQKCGAKVLDLSDEEFDAWLGTDKLIDESCYACGSETSTTAMPNLPADTASSQSTPVLRSPSMPPYIGKPSLGTVVTGVAASEDTSKEEEDEELDALPEGLFEYVDDNTADIDDKITRLNSSYKTALAYPDSPPKAGLYQGHMDLRLGTSIVAVHDGRPPTNPLFRPARADTTADPGYPRHHGLYQFDMDMAPRTSVAAVRGGVQSAGRSFQRARDRNHLSECKTRTKRRFAAVLESSGEAMESAKRRKVETVEASFGYRLTSMFEAMRARVARYWA